MVDTSSVCFRGSSLLGSTSVQTHEQQITLSTLRATSQQHYGRLYFVSNHLPGQHQHLLGFVTCYGQWNMSECDATCEQVL